MQERAYRAPHYNLHKYDSLASINQTTLKVYCNNSNHIWCIRVNEQCGIITVPWKLLTR